ncbi:glycoside hydrolase family 88 protein [Martelella mediterranea]|uniref:Unsaturated chondroitin disaccharide hydrolase n=1 Tax=Martelella mediterranea TaxID=293089 RepID=A0A4R3NKE4_9HYPH|nr:glycoside hydrolase family 88 protein [Martelella mediterranea]TCT34744.1 unsaturated chondroitin disaccharide hydrolase [Martelella mediterranea]
MNLIADSYFARESDVRSRAEHQAALLRCVERLREQMPSVGLRNPKIGNARNRWIYCDGADWVMGFQTGQLWLAYQLTGSSAFKNAAKARRPDFEQVLRDRRLRDHDLGFQFSLSSVAEWLLTGDRSARAMGLAAADALLARFKPEGGYIQAWSAKGMHDREKAAFANGRMIADTMQNLALLYWAHRETAIEDYRDVAQIHAATAASYLVREDDTSFHTFVFDPSTGEPIRGETHQGYADSSCWARGQAWLMHGFAQCYAATKDTVHLEVARRLSAKAEALVGSASVPVWDFNLPDNETPYVDSSAGAVMAAGLYLLADQDIPAEEAGRWRAFADRLIDGLLLTCDLTKTEGAQGLLAHGAAHVPAGRCDTMLPYGDYYFMEALMRSEGHTRFFW